MGSRGFPPAWFGGVLGGELIDSSEGKLEWIPDEHVLDLNLWESDQIFMPWIQQGEFFSTKLNMIGITCAAMTSFFIAKNRYFSLMKSGSS